MSQRTIEWAIERLEICQDQAFQSCECEECQQCGKMPDECSGTECAKTCQCSTCDHCSNELVLAELRSLLAAPYVDRQDDDLLSGLKDLVIVGEYPSANDADAHDEWLDNNASTAIWLLGNLDRIRCALNYRTSPAVELDLTYNKMTEGLHIRRWENLGGLREGIHRLYICPTAPKKTGD